jgi:magnesium chelatase family protein
MAITLFSAAVFGLDSRRVEVEIEIVKNLSEFKIVGLPDTTISEAKERVRSAIKNSGAKFPSSKIIANLAPADLKKVGSYYDFPLAVGILAASKQVHLDRKALFVGELALDGTLRPVTGVLSVALLVKELGLSSLYVPQANAAEAALVSGITVYAIPSLQEFISHARGEKKFVPFQMPLQQKDVVPPSLFLFEHIRGQEQAKLALEIAASGAHNILLWGPPGSGKTMLAKSLPSILPSLTYDEALEVTQIYSVAGMLPSVSTLVRARPFRSPHHTATAGALVGGGRIPRPGEISLAHRGVLFLDEFAEFSRYVLENLRQPLEDHMITIARTAGAVTYPAQIMLVAALNPCPCGKAGSSDAECTCSTMHIQRYQKKISGPLLDRIDLHIEVPRVAVSDLEGRGSEATAEVRARVCRARDVQKKRFAGTRLTCNAEMNSVEIRRFCTLEESAHVLLTSAAESLHLSARGFYKVIKLARTIADLAEAENIRKQDIALALSFREKTVFS